VEIGRRVLYNLIRIHALNGEKATQQQFQSWQIQDYRYLSTQKIFETLRQLGYRIDLPGFLAYAQEYDEPEAFIDDFLDEEDDVAVQDQLYLLFFELWRRHLPEKRSLSIFCDEIDYLVTEYDRVSSLESSGKVRPRLLPEDASMLQKELAKDPHQAIYNLLDELVSLLEEVEESGTDISEAFSAVLDNCANDVEAFLFDFLGQQIELDAYSAVETYLSFFTDVVKGCCWLDFLRLKVTYIVNPSEATVWLNRIMDTYNDGKVLEDKEYYGEIGMEILYFLLESQNDLLFYKHLPAIIRTLTTKEQLQDLQEMTNAVSDHVLESMGSNQLKEVFKKELNQLEMLYKKLLEGSAKIEVDNIVKQAQVCHRLAVAPSLEGSGDEG
jgi:hypothetical protein